jgi:dTDP-4-amino-4,6-dideoxygalactose transaminase
MYHLLLPSQDERDGLIEHLARAGIQSVFHYLPLHLSPMGRAFGGAPGDCPVTESVSDRLVRLPFFNNLGEAEQARIVAEVVAYRRPGRAAGSRS